MLHKIKYDSQYIYKYAKNIKKGKMQNTHTVSVLNNLYLKFEKAVIFKNNLYKLQ